MLETCRQSVSEQTATVAHLVGEDTHRHGPAHVRNRLAIQADTEWLLPLDDDDQLDPGCAERLLEESGRADIVVPWCRVKDHGDIPAWSPNRFHRPETLLVHNYIPTTALIRRELWQQVGGQPEGVQVEDWRFWRKCLAAGARFHVVPEVLWTYNRYQGSRNEWGPS